LNAYTKKIQEINKNEESNIQLNVQAINVADFIQNIHSAYDKLAMIEFDFGASQSVIYADEVHFSNVMDNLIENAIKYSDPPAQIKITVKADVQHTIISVKDKGFGITPFDRNQIFDKFFRVSDKRVLKKDGFGLGLTYVKSIMEAHGGTITVESELNKGSTFTITLPHR
jgi:two-component system phosphate regulon sensor histidine kinase PhoR